MLKQFVFALGYVADAAVVGSYWLLVRNRCSLRVMNWANALGAFPVGATEFYGRAWPALAITCAFGFVGWHGVFTKTHGEPTVH